MQKYVHKQHEASIICNIKFRSALCAKQCYIALLRAERAENFDLLLPRRDPQTDTLMILKICLKSGARHYKTMI